MALLLSGTSELYCCQPCPSLALQDKANVIYKNSSSQKRKFSHYFNHFIPNRITFFLLRSTKSEYLKNTNI